MSVDLEVTAERQRPRPGYAGWLWLLPAALGGVLALLIMVVLPPDRTLDNVGELAFKTAPLLCAVLAVAAFPRRGRVLPWLVLLGVVGYMGFVDSAYVVRTLRYVESAAAGESGQFPSFYQFTLFVNAFTVLFALFAYQVGGASAARVLKVGLAGVLVVLSGLNDLTFWAMYDWPDGRPDRLDWASHIAVFLGDPPTVTQAVIFVAVHLALAAVVMLLPVQRWLDRFAGRWD